MLLSKAKATDLGEYFYSTRHRLACLVLEIAFSDGTVQLMENDLESNSKDFFISNEVAK